MLSRKIHDFSNKTKHSSSIPLTVNKQCIERVTTVNFLGIQLRENLSWKCQTTSALQKIKLNMGAVIKVKQYLNLTYATVSLVGVMDKIP